MRTPGAEVVPSLWGGSLVGSSRSEAFPAAHAAVLFRCMAFGLVAARHCHSRRACQAWAVDDHQRKMWAAMLIQIGEYRAGRLRLGALIGGLRGLFVEADPHDAAIREQFEDMWSPIDAEHELRTEPWAPAGSASDEALDQALDTFTEWVSAILAADSTREHN